MAKFTSQSHLGHLGPYPRHVQSQGAPRSLISFTLALAAMRAMITLESPLLAAHILRFARSILEKWKVWGKIREHLPTHWWHPAHVSHHVPLCWPAMSSVIPNHGQDFVDETWTQSLKSVIVTALLRNFESMSSKLSHKWCYSGMLGSSWNRGFLISALPPTGCN